MAKSKKEGKRENACFHIVCLGIDLIGIIYIAQ